LGYRLFRCRPCRRTFNARTGTPFNHLQVPTDIALLVVLWRLRDTLSLRDLAEMFLTRGFTFTHETVREWEARFAPLVAERGRAKQHGKAWTRPNASSRARTVVGHAPEKVTTDGHDAYPRAIRETLGPEVRHRTSRYMNNRMEQDHRGIKQRYYPMRGFGSPMRGFGSVASAARFYTAHDELRDHFRCRRHLNETVSLAAQRRLFQDRWGEVCAVLQAA